MEDIWGEPKEIPVATFKDTNPNVYVEHANECIGRGDYKQAFLDLQYSLLMSDYDKHYLKGLEAFCDAISNIDDCAESFIEALGLISLESRNKLQSDNAKKMLLGHLERLCNLYIRKTKKQNYRDRKLIESCYSYI